jgi:hypothetical protein
MLALEGSDISFLRSLDCFKRPIAIYILLLTEHLLFYTPAGWAAFVGT